MTFHSRIAVIWVSLFSMNLLFAQGAEATEREVCLSGCAYSSIQEAIDASVGGDSVVVHEGTYLENIVIDKDLTVESLLGPAQTSLVAESWKPCVSFVGAQESSLIGFSVQGGKVPRYEPSGIYIGPDVTNATISDCVVKNSAGVGIFNDSGRLTLSESMVVDNRPGPGLLLGGEHNRIEKSVISGNDDSGIALGPYSALTVVNSFITGNFAVSGGGIAVGSHSELHITNSTIAGNLGGDRLKSKGGGILLYGANKVGIVNSILWGNYPYSIQRQDDADIIGLLYSDLQDFTFLYRKAKGEGVISSKPLFVDPRPAFSAPSSEGDYHLKKGSPCRDRGTSALAIYPLPDDDIDGQLRPQGPGYDMGADEYFLTDTVAPLPDIAVNSSDSPSAVIKHLNQRVYATIGLNPGSAADQDADWWIVVKPPFPYTMFSIIYDGRRWKKGITVSKQDILEHVDPRLIFYQNSSRMPVGTYALFFGVDLDMNGKLDKKLLFFDTARVVITP